MRRSLAIIALLLLAGCLEGALPPGGEEGPATPATMTPITPMTPTSEATPTIRSLASGSFASTGEEARLVFTDAVSFEAFWETVREEPGDPVPEVDFTREIAVAAVSGPRPNACWLVRVTNATVSTVEVTTYSPPPEMMCITVISYPWHIVAIAGAGRSPTFVEREAQGPPPS